MKKIVRQVGYLQRFIIIRTFQDKNVLDWHLFCMGAKHDYFTLNVYIICKFL